MLLKFMRRFPHKGFIAGCSTLTLLFSGVVAASAVDPVVELVPKFVYDVFEPKSLGSDIFLFGRDSQASETSHHQLWRFDGQRFHAEPGFQVSGVRGPIDSLVFQDKIFFVAEARFAIEDPFSAIALWQFDPKIAQGHPDRIKQVVNDGGLQFGFAELCRPMLSEFESKLYFCATSGNQGFELHEFDPLPEDGATFVTQVANLNLDTQVIGSSHPSDFEIFKGKLYFSADDGSGARLWSFDGDSTPTKVAAASHLEGPYDLAVLNEKLFFGANTVAVGTELFSFDGENASLAADIIAGPTGSQPYGMTAFQNKLYMSAEYLDQDGCIDAEPWVFDGVAVTRLADINPQPADGGCQDYGTGSWPQDFQAIGNLLLFNAANVDGAYHVWLHDGTSIVTSLSTAVGSTDLQRSGVESQFGFLELNDRVYFGATATNVRNERNRLFSVSVTALSNLGPVELGGADSRSGPTNSVVPILEPPVSSPPMPSPSQATAAIRRLSEGEAKVWVRDVVGEGKVQILLNGRELGWVRAIDATDPKLRVPSTGPMAGRAYFVRTAQLAAGKNVLEVYVDGERVRRVVYSR
jgi:ELWxxDGT repeat protein